MNISINDPQSREIVPVINGYIKLRAEDHRRQDEAKGILRGASFYWVTSNYAFWCTLRSSQPHLSLLYSGTSWHCHVCGFPCSQSPFIKTVICIRVVCMHGSPIQQYHSSTDFLHFCVCIAYKLAVRGLAAGEFAAILPRPQYK